MKMRNVLFTLCISLTVLILTASLDAQSILWQTYTDRAKQAAAANDYNAAEKLFRSALAEAESLNDSEMTALSYANFGAVLSFQKKYVEAEKSFLKAISIREERGVADSLDSSSQF